MMKQFEIDVRLRILDFDIPYQNLSEIIGINPTRVWNKGDKIDPRTSLVFKENGWEISSGIMKYKDFELHIEEIIKKIEPKIDVFINLGKTCFIELSCGIYLYKNESTLTPSINFQKEYIEILSKIGCSIDIDLIVI